jgi:hypothetical protein
MTAVTTMTSVTSVTSMTDTVVSGGEKRFCQTGGARTARIGPAARVGGYTSGSRGIV